MRGHSLLTLAVAQVRHSIDGSVPLFHELEQFGHKVSLDESIEGRGGKVGPLRVVGRGVPSPCVGTHIAEGNGRRLEKGRIWDSSNYISFPVLTMDQGKMLRMA